MYPLPWFLSVFFSDCRFLQFVYVYMCWVFVVLFILAVLWHPWISGLIFSLILDSCPSLLLQIFLLLSSVFLLSLLLPTYISFHFLTIFWLFSSAFFFILFFLFAFQFGDLQAHGFFPWLSRGWISLVSLFYFPLLILGFPTHLSSEKVCCHVALNCRLLLYRSSVGRSVNCWGRVVFYNLITSPSFNVSVF